ncbi:histidinol-phosphate aminotransferase [Hasllibacter halocynthiae]|uniref:Histidinol-phosphate aminotransferase n=2 Tax=Hasllibacter halocynthiae TaxID=595589 RepID=A0A2T0X6F0_9RHOB|nr:histidinol-phosphate aminotransferase [Hasllibacter halocynthiae]
MGRRFDARLGANESVFGPSPRALEAIAGCGVWMYGDPEAHDLRRALAERHGAGIGNVVVGEGIDGLLGTLVRLTVEPGVSVVTSAGAYPTFSYHVRGFGGVLRTVPYRGDREDPEALLACAGEVGARLIYLANPDNPMGSWHDAAAVEAMIERLPRGCILVLDEAYADTAPPGAVPRVDLAKPVVRMRTFSKAHGLAGIRIGYAIGPETLIGAFDRVRNHFGVSRPAQAAALASLRDGAHLAATVTRIAGARERIATIVERHGLRALPSATNFVAVDCGSDGAFARAVLDGLAARGVFVRMPAVPPLDRCIRVSAGNSQDLDRLDAALGPALVDAGSRRVD